MADQQSYRAAIAAALALPPDGPVVVAVDDIADQELTSTVQKAQSAGAAWVIEVPGVGATLELLAGDDNLTVFHVDEVPGSVFVTNEPLAPEQSNVLVTKGRIGYRAPAQATGDLSAPVATEPLSNHVARIVKTAEERFVFGVVLVPETQDSQGDIYSHGEVRKAAHTYMEKAQALGKQHAEIVTGKLKILESYVAPVDFTLDAETIAKGTWLFGIRVVDDELWESVKKGEFTGFSIGGEAFRRPEEPAH